MAPERRTLDRPKTVKAWGAWSIDQDHPRALYLHHSAGSHEVPLDRLKTFAQFVKLLKGVGERSFCRPAQVEDLGRAIQDLVGLRLHMHRADIGDRRSELRVSPTVDVLEREDVYRPDLRTMFRASLGAWSRSEGEQRHASAAVAELPTRPQDAELLAATATVVAAVIARSPGESVDLNELVRRTSTCLRAVKPRAILDPASRIAAARLLASTHPEIEAAIAEAAIALGATRTLGPTDT